MPLPAWMLFLLFALLPHAQSAAPSLPVPMAASLAPCSVNFTYDVPMSDGVQLSTLVAPCSRPPCPTLLQRTPYDKMGLVRLECAVLQQRGFNAVFQDVRGTHASGGNFSMFLMDGSDGYDTMAWIAQQPWHAGGIATNGASALGIVQFAVAVLRSPHHAGMWIDWASPSGKHVMLRPRAALLTSTHACPSHSRRVCLLNLFQVFSQLSFPQGCFRQHDVTGWLNATARDAPDIMRVRAAALCKAVVCLLPRDASARSLCDAAAEIARLRGRHMAAC